MTYQVRWEHGSLDHRSGPVLVVALRTVNEALDDTSLDTIQIETGESETSWTLYGVNAERMASRLAEVIRGELAEADIPAPHVAIRQV